MAVSLRSRAIDDATAKMRYVQSGGPSAWYQAHSDPEAPKRSLYRVLDICTEIRAIYNSRQRRIVVGEDDSSDMLSHAQRVVAAVESDKLRLEEDIAPNLERRGGGLDTAEASCGRSRQLTQSFVDQNGGKTHCCLGPGRS